MVEPVMNTEGDVILGLVVVTSSGEPISMGTSAVRNVLRIIDGLLSYAVGLIAMLVSDDRRRVGDMAADTVVVRAE